MTVEWANAVMAILRSVRLHALEEAAIVAETCRHGQEAVEIRKLKDIRD